MHLIYRELSLISRRKMIKNPSFLSNRTLLLNEGIPRAYRRKKLRLKIYCYFPQKIMASSLSTLRAEYSWRAISRTLPSNLKLPLISEEIFNLSNLRVLPAKSNCKMPSDFWWKRQVFFPLINIFFLFF